MWVSRTFAELGYTYTGLSGKKKADFGAGVPYVPYMNVFSNEKVDVDAFEYVHVGSGERQNVVAIGDALFTTSSETPQEVGMSSVLTEKTGNVYLNSFCFGFRFHKPSDFVPDFLAYALRSQQIRHQMFIAAQGSTRHNLSKENFGKMTLSYPASPDEQRRIAEILTTADETIAASRALLEKYAAVKLGLLRDLLGAREWTNKTFAELGYTYTGLRGKKKGDFGAGMPYVPYMNVFSNEKVDVDAFEYVHIGNGERQNLVAVGDVLFTTSSETPQEVGMSSVLTEKTGNVYLNSFCFGFRFHKPSDFVPDFLAYALRSQQIRHQMFIAAQGSTRHNLSKENFGKMTFSYPVSLAEQRRIAKILTTADDRLKAEQKRLAKLEDIKRGLMDDLLTNKVSADKF